MTDPLLRGGRPWGHGGPADILMRDGVIDRIEPGLDVLDAETFDIAGRLVLPGLVDAHGHLDKTLYGGRGRRTRLRTTSPTGSQTKDADGASLACPTWTS